MIDTRLHHPCNIIVSGSTGSGKTSNIIYNLLKYKSLIFSSAPAHVIYFYSEYQDVFNKMKNKELVNEFINETPSLDLVIARIQSHKKHGVICVIDDFLHEVNNELAQIFTKISHHHNATVIFTSQSLFYENKEYRTISLNAHYLFLMKSPRNNNQIINLAKQISPYHTKYIVESFQSATDKPYSYLFFDFHQKQADGFRIRSNIFKHEWPMITFMEKSNK